MTDIIETQRKKLAYRSKNRGCRETDILLGKFAESELSKFSAEELNLFEQFLDEYDGDIYKWLTKQVEMPPEYAQNVGKKLLEFKYTS